MSLTFPIFIFLFNSKREKKNEFQMSKLAIKRSIKIHSNECESASEREKKRSTVTVVLCTDYTPKEFK